MLERMIQVFRPHHQELRERLVRIFLSITVCTVAAYFFSKEIAAYFIAPLYEATPHMDKLVYTNLTEAFISYLKLSLLIGLLASFPVILYQCWSFISPGLTKKERRLAATVVFWGTLLFCLGAFFAVFGVLPRMLHYFMSYASESLEPLPRLGKYLTFIARTLLAFGLAFQIPFLMVMAGRGNIVSHTYFSTKRIYFYGAIAVLSFLLSAGDIMATILLTFPLIGLYEIGIVLMKLFGGKSADSVETPQNGTQ